MPAEHSGQRYICSINGIAAGGGYELALACEQILLADDGSSAVSLPELPLLAVLPGTGGLTRLVDKRLVRRDHADFFCTTAEGVRGKRARDWRLVDKLVPAEQARRRDARRSPRTSRRKSDRPEGRQGHRPADGRTHASRATRCATARSPSRSTASAAPRVCASTARPSAPPADAAAIQPQGGRLLAAGAGPRARRRDDASAPQRDRDRHLGAAEPGRCRRWSKPTTRCSTSEAGELAGARDRALLEAHPEAARRQLAQPDRAGRARLVLRRHAVRARARGRPLLHAGRRLRGLQPAGRHGEADAR